MVRGFIGCGILLVDWLDQFRLFGFKLGFWFAQQGSIYTFVVLVFIYVWQTGRLDKRFEELRERVANDEVAS